MNSYALQNEFVIHNYQLSIAELVKYFANYDSIFFFCPKYSRSVIETAVKMTLEDISDYNPCKIFNSLLTSINDDIELFQSKNPHPSLDDSDFLNQVELITEQIEKYTNSYIRNKLPINQQCQIVSPVWLGDNLIFGLRIY